MLQVVLNRFRTKFLDLTETSATRSGAEPTIGASTLANLRDATIDRSPASLHRPMIGSDAPPAPTALRTAAAPIIGSKHGRGRSHADKFAVAFLGWLERRTPASAMIPVDMIIDLAATKFAPSTGMPMPPVRNLLGALKRAPGVRVKRDVRIRDARGDVVGKTTMYLLPSTVALTETVQRAA